MTSSLLVYYHYNGKQGSTCKKTVLTMLNISSKTTLGIIALISFIGLTTMLYKASAMLCVNKTVKNG